MYKEFTYLLSPSPPHYPAIFQTNGGIGLGARGEGARPQPWKNSAPSTDGPRRPLAPPRPVHRCRAEEEGAPSGRRRGRRMRGCWPPWRPDLAPPAMVKRKRKPHAIHGEEDADLASLPLEKRKRRSSGMGKRKRRLRRWPPATRKRRSRRHSPAAKGKRVLAGHGEERALAHAESSQVRFHSIRRGRPLYWDSPLPVIVQYQGIGSSMPSLNSMYIQTSVLRKSDSNSIVWAPIPTSKHSLRFCALPVQVYLLLYEHQTDQL